MPAADLNRVIEGVSSLAGSSTDLAGTFDGGVGVGILNRIETAKLRSVTRPGAALAPSPSGSANVEINFRFGWKLVVEDNVHLPNIQAACATSWLPRPLHFIREPNQPLGTLKLL